MKTSQNGFVVPLILGIVAILLIGGGAYVYLNQHKNPAASSTNENSNESVPSLRNFNESSTTTSTTSSSQSVNTSSQQSNSNVENQRGIPVRITSITPTTGEIGPLGLKVSITGTGFTNFSRLEFYQNGQLITYLPVTTEGSDTVIVDPTQIQFKITYGVLIHGLNSRTGQYQIDVANIDCGNGSALGGGIACTSNTISNKLNLTLSVAEPASTRVLHISEPFPMRNDGKFWGNDLITFNWSSNEPTTRPVVRLDNVQNNVSYASKDLNPGTVGYTGRFGDGISPNLNLPTGIYRIKICDFGYQYPSGDPACATSNNFSVTATTTPFQP